MLRGWCGDSFILRDDTECGRVHVSDASGGCVGEDGGLSKVRHGSGGDIAGVGAGGVHVPDASGDREGRTGELSDMRNGSGADREVTAEQENPELKSMRGGSGWEWR